MLKNSFADVFLASLTSQLLMAGFVNFPMGMCVPAEARLEKKQRCESDASAVPLVREEDNSTHASNAGSGDKADLRSEVMMPIAGWRVSSQAVIAWENADNGVIP